MRVASVVVALACTTGCISYSGNARAIDPTRLATEPGWIVAGPTPALQQRDVRDCGAAAVAMVARRWGVELSVANAAAALPAPTVLGTRLGDLRDLARSHGLTAFAIAGDRVTIIHELGEGRPVIVGLFLPYGRKRALSHYEVIVAVHLRDGEVVTIDPAGGWRTRTWAGLDAEWVPAGRPTLVVLGRRSPVAGSAREISRPGGRAAR